MEELFNGDQKTKRRVNSNDYDTNSKWGENKWVIVGDTEEVYEGVEREEEDE